MKATLILAPEEGEELTGAVVAEVVDVVADGEFGAEPVSACYIERLGPLSALARLGREPEGIPLCVYVRPTVAAKPTPKGA